MKMFSFRKKEPVVAKVSIKNRLRITYKDGGYDDWSIADYPEGDSKITPWIEFYKWFFSRKSGVYIMITGTCDKAIFRNDIKRFMVSLIEVNDDL